MLEKTHFFVNWNKLPAFVEDVWNFISGSEISLCLCPQYISLMCFVSSFPRETTSVDTYLCVVALRCWERVVRSVVCEKKTIYRTSSSFVRKCHSLYGLHQDGCRRRKGYRQSKGRCPLQGAVQTPLSTLHHGCPGAWSSCAGRAVTCGRWEHNPCQANGVCLSTADWEHLSRLCFIVHSWVFNVMNILAQSLCIL